MLLHVMTLSAIYSFDALCVCVCECHIQSAITHSQQQLNLKTRVHYRSFPLSGFFSFSSYDCGIKLKQIFCLAKLSVVLVLIMSVQHQAH